MANRIMWRAEIDGANIYWLENEQRYWMMPADPRAAREFLNARIDAIWITNAYETLDPALITRLSWEAKR